MENRGNGEFIVVKKLSIDSDFSTFDSGICPVEWNSMGKEGTLFKDFSRKCVKLWKTTNMESGKSADERARTASGIT